MGKNGFVPRSLYQYSRFRAKSLKCFMRIPPKRLLCLLSVRVSFHVLNLLGCPGRTSPDSLLLIPYNSNTQGSTPSSFTDIWERTMERHTIIHTYTHARARARQYQASLPPPFSPLQADLLEEVPLASGREGHLPARGERQFVSHVVGLLAEVRVLLRGTDRGSRACAQLQGRGRRVRADMLGAACQPGPWVAAGRVGAGLARVRARVRLLEE